MMLKKLAIPLMIAFRIPAMPLMTEVMQRPIVAKRDLTVERVSRCFKDSRIVLREQRKLTARDDSTHDCGFVFEIECDLIVVVLNFES
jgi:hypothetical protein